MTWGTRVAAALLALLAVPPGLSGATQGSARSDRVAERSPSAMPRWQPESVLTLAAPGPEMVLIPTSTFTMGSTEEDVLLALTDCQKEPRGHQCEASQFADEMPVRRVTVSSFFIDRTEVSVAAYARCAALHRCEPLPLGEGARRFDRPTLPASLVTFHEAQAYCAFRGGRLPTEAEFERAARGETGRRYPWGNLYNSHAANHGRLAWTQTDASDGFAELAPVGSFPSGRTPEGILDLAGNVAEWVQDRYAPTYSESDLRNPKGPASSSMGPARVIRGGSYENGAAWLRGASRAAADPGVRRPTIGFRCARGATRSEEE